jgi:DNA-binding CsgD family transcriptional regulator
VALATSDVLRAFGTLGELGRGQPPGHSWRACLTGLAIAGEMGASADERAAVFATSLLFHAGCTAGSSQFAALIAADELAAKRDRCLCDPDNLSDIFAHVTRQAATGGPLSKRIGVALPIIGETAFLELDRGCSDVGANVARRLGLPALVVQSLGRVCETWNGRGAYKTVGAAIPLPTRIVQTAMVAEVFASDGGVDRARGAVTDRAGTFLDPDVARAFASVSRRAAFAEGLAAETADDFGFEPTSQEAVVSALADVVDLKSSATTVHGRTTAQLSLETAGILGASDEDATLSRDAALVHDIGKVAVPRSVLDKRTGRSRLEEEQLRLHVAFTERILRSAHSLAPLADIAILHHERPDGTGYPAGARALPLAAAILAVVDAFLEERDARTGSPSEITADAFVAVRGQALDRTIIDALATVLETRSGRRAPKGPADLSEREMDVLVLVGRGFTNAEVARELHVSPHTIRHHLESIYEKIDVTSRAGATLFASEHGLL